MKILFRKSYLLEIFSICFMGGLIAQVEDTISDSHETVTEVLNDIHSGIPVDSTGNILPPPNPTDTDAFYDYWFMWVGLLSPFLIWLVGKISPSSSKQTLIIRATTIGLGVIAIFIYMKGLSVAVIMQAVMAFVLKVFSYQKVYKPLGLESSKTYKEK